MPIRHGGIAATRASIWPRDHFCRRTIAPRWSSPTTWNEFLPISIPIVAMVAIDLLDMAVLRLTLAPSQHRSPVGQEHGRTIPLAAFQPSGGFGRVQGPIRKARNIFRTKVNSLTTKVPAPQSDC